MRRPTLSQACRDYPHRYTMQHRPAWAETPSPDGRRYAPQYRTDQEWYDNTVFPGERVDMTPGHCESNNPSWPLGQWLS